jgi:hypothetical protein
MLLGCSKIYFNDTKSGVDQETDACAVTPVTSNVVAVDWMQATEVDFTEADLEAEPQPNASFASLAPAAGQAKSYDGWKKAFADWLFRGRELKLFRSPSLKQTSQPNESERDFRVRISQSSREQRDAAVEKLKQKYASKFTTLQDRIRRAEQAVQREQEQASASKWNTAISVGSTVLGAIFGRKTLSAGNISRAGTAARGAGRVYKESQDVARAGETVEAMKQQLADLETQVNEETNQIAASMDASTETLETITLRPKKTDITVRSLVLAWAPYWRTGETDTSAWE